MLSLCRILGLQAQDTAPCRRAITFSLRLIGLPIQRVLCMPAPLTHMLGIVAAGRRTGSPQAAAGLASWRLAAPQVRHRLQLVSWPSKLAADIEEAGLHLADVVIIADPGAGVTQVVPAVEFAHWPSTVPAPLLAFNIAAWLARHGCVPIPHTLLHYFPTPIPAVQRLLPYSSNSLALCAAFHAFQRAQPSTPRRPNR